MRLIGAKLLTLDAVTCFNRASLFGVEVRLAGAPVRAEGKEFLLTVGGQSVTTIFTASDFSVPFCICVL
jgi:hypothetical protein